MPNRTLEEKNIDRLLVHFQQQGQQPAIQEWRQRIEEREAPLALRPPKTIDTEQAIQDFRHALLGDTEHSESAEGLLRELNQSAQPKFTAAEAWKALAHPPKKPSPELRAYLDHHAKLELEKRKWEFEATDEQWRHLDELSNLGQWDQYNQELVSLFEVHLDGHPSLDEELILLFTEAQMRSPMTLHAKEAETFHSSGLFWLAANIAFKRHGLDGRIEKYVLGWVERHWKKSRVSKDERIFVFGQSYAQVRKQLFIRGAHTVRRLEHFLAISVKNLMIRTTGYDPNGRRKNEKVELPKYPGSDLIFNKGDEAPIPEFGEILDTVRNTSPEGFPEQDAIVNSFLQDLPERDRSILLFSMANPDATDKETADAFGISTKTIQRVRQAAGKRWEKLA